MQISGRGSQETHDVVDADGNLIARCANKAAATRKLNALRRGALAGISDNPDTFTVRKVTPKVEES